MNFKEFQPQIIDKCHKEKACLGQFRRLHKAFVKKDPVEFVRVLLDNHRWCAYSGIYDAADILALDDQDILLEAGLKTQLNMPIDFQPERVAEQLWKPFNEGATGGNWEGDYMTFDQANDPEAGRIIPTARDFIELSRRKEEWSIYQNQFGYLFDGRLFIPAGGYRERANGALMNVGSYGYSWSSSVSGTNGMHLWFYSAGLCPSYTSYRAYGLQVRCLQE